MPRLEYDKTAWYAQPGSMVDDLYNDDDRVVYLHGRKCDDGEWEYVAIAHRWQSPWIVWQLKGGKMVRDGD